MRAIRRWLGEQRLAGTGTYAVTRRHDDYLESVGFAVESREYLVERVWTADEVVGYLYSTSFASPRLLGDLREAFEADVRAGSPRCRLRIPIRRLSTSI